MPIQLYPTTAPQDEATTDLLFHVRDDIIPAVEAETGAQAYVGGFQAVTVDFTKVLTDALPWFLLIVVGLGFLAMVVLFRSVIVAATGSAVKPAVAGGRDGYHRGGLPVGLVWRPDRLAGHRADLPVPADHGLRHLVRALLRLPGVPGQPHARGVDAHSATTARPSVAGWPDRVGLSPSLRPS